MASLYKQKTSQYWWIKFRDPTTGRTLRQSTGYRIGVGAELRRAQIEVAAKTLAERQAPATRLGAWDSWVTDYIHARVTGHTRRNYLIMWRNLRTWLTTTHVELPRQLTYLHCSGYVAWRLAAHPEHGMRSVNRNTAALEFNLLRLLLREAVHRDYCPTNPAREVVVRHAPRRLFPSLTDTQLQTIYAAILTENDRWRTCAQRAFALSILHGVRLNETNPNPTTAVALDGPFPTITFRQKGNRIRVKALHPQLVPLFTTLQQAHATETYHLTATSHHENYVPWYNWWSRFFRRHNLTDAIPNLCFHSLRVTVENTLRRAGIEQRLREAYLTHEHQADINARYDRVDCEEMLACHAPLHRPWLKL